MSLENFCRKPVIKILPEKSVAEACRVMEQNNIGCLVVENDGKLCGIITDRDIALKVAGALRDPQKTTVQEIMTADPIRVSMDKDLPHLTSLMHAFHVRRLPIVNGHDTIVGIVTLDDIVALIANEMSEIGKAISDGFTHSSVKY
jgi:CBS domain-containing protein